MVQRLFVTNNRDSGAGSFRAALEASQNGTGDFEIIFRGVNNANTNSLGTGEFTISLLTPLPNIWRNNVNINTTDTRQVLLVPATVNAASSSAGPMRRTTVNGIDPNTNGSLLYVGDVNNLNSRSSNTPPNVIIEGISFSSNIARGDSGDRGGGGGGGAPAGAITLVSGNLTIRDSIFQRLRSIGGAGAPSAAEGQEFNAGRRRHRADATNWRNDTLINGNNGRSGENGGRGGATAFHRRINNAGVLEDQFNFRPHGGLGGLGGFRNSHWNLPAAGEGRAWGQPGSNGGSTSIFGMGGGGGGGGGRGGFHTPSRHIAWIRVDADPIRRDGGAGGFGGSSGPHGGAGGTGRNGWKFPQVGRRGERWGPDPSGRVILQDRNAYFPASRTYSDGGNGIGIGQAIGILGDRDRNGQNARLNLENVDFIGVPGRLISARDSNRNVVQISNVRFGKNRHRLRRLKLNNRRQGPNRPMQDFRGNSDENVAPLQTGVSSPRVPNILDVSNTNLVATHGIADQFVIGFENASSFAGLLSDASDPNNQFNQLWRAIVPDREEEILAEFQAETNSVFSDVAGQHVRDIGISVTSNLIGEAITSTLAQTALAGATGPALAGFGLMNSFLGDLSAARANRAMLARRKEQALAENRQTQKELFATLESQSESFVGSVDLSRQRSIVEIHDFTLGEDTVILPNTPGSIDPNIVQSQSGNGPISIEFRFSDQANNPNHFLTLHLSDESLNEFVRARAQENVNLLFLTHEDEFGRRIISTRGRNPLIVDRPSYSGLVGGHLYIVDRKSQRRPDSERFDIQLSKSSDTIYGTSGFEEIRTNAGNDLVFPTAARDKNRDLQERDLVFGGDGDDIVSYAVDGVELNFRSEKVSDNESKINVYEKGKKIGVLRDFESFHAFGASDIDLSKATEYNRNFSDSYTIVTGLGGNLIGSDWNDNFMISCDDKFNENAAVALQSLTTIEGGAGDDYLYVDLRNSSGDYAIQKAGNGEINVIYNDTIIISASGIKAIDVETSDGVVNFETAFLAESFSFKNDQYLKLVGTEQADTIGGGAYNDNIHGYGGDDTIRAGSDDDYLSGGGGGDTFFPGLGDDLVDLGTGDSDRVVLEGGNDTLINFDTKDDSLALLGTSPLVIGTEAEMTDDTNVILGESVIQYKNNFGWNLVKFEGPMVDTSYVDLSDGGDALNIYNNV